MANWASTIRKKKSKEISLKESLMMLWEREYQSSDVKKSPTYAEAEGKSYLGLNRHIGFAHFKPIEPWITEARAASMTVLSRIAEKAVQESILLDNEIIAILNYSDEVLIQEIEDSKYIYDLNDDWDDEGSQGYEKSTWKNAVQFLIRYVNQLYKHFELKVDVPSIEHGPNGSIDLIWQKDNCRLIANIESNINDAVKFYGDDRNQSTYKGTIPYESINDTFLLWLKNLQKSKK